MSRMSNLFSRIFAARVTRDPPRPDQRHVNISRTSAGIVITADNCITVPAVTACLRYLTQTVAVLPWRVLLTAGKQGAEEATGHPIDNLLSRPNAEWSSFQFRETLLHWALRWGNGYAEIERDALGRVVAMWPIHPARVQAMRTDPGNALYYRVSNGTTPPTDIMAADMFHVRGFGDGVVGLNVCEYAAETIGWARAAQLFGSSFFGQGLNVSGVVQSKTGLSEPAMKRLQARFNRLYRGVRGEKVMYLDAGMEFKAIGMEPEKAQFIATNEYLVLEICRVFGVPPHKVGSLDRSTKSNAESLVTEVVVDAITPWAKRFEDEADNKLFGANRKGYFTKLNLNALMRGDSDSRAKYYQAMRQMGVYSANDILRLEDENLIPESEGGDKRFMQIQYVTLDKAGDGPPVAAPAEPPDAADDKADTTGKEPAPDDSPAEKAAKASLREMEIAYVF